MKNTLYLSILAAALMGGQVFADVIPTVLEGISFTSGSLHAGANNPSGEASGGNVSISYSATGSDYFTAQVYGGRGVTATSNKVTMTGGLVNQLLGGRGETSASGNTVIMTGGSVRSVRSGSGNNVSGFASGNVAIVAGDCEITGALYGGGAVKNATANDNKVYLVGKGATATIADAQGNTAAYTGGTISVGAVYGGITGSSSTSTGTKEGNSIDIYGTGITAAEMACMQILNFHIADGVLLSQEAMVSLTSTTTSGALDLTGVEIGFNAADVQDWGAYEGQSITLVNAVQAITVGEGSMGEVAIKGADGATVATATLGLGNENKSLVLSNIKGTAPVPEPTTGTLGLLALAGLCIRRRK